jgi:glycosyltransferase involved in cell wall biosynthesis
MACSNSWTSPFQVGSHHLAKEFLKLGYEIAFVSDPISPFHLWQRQNHQERFALYAKGGLQEDKLFAYTPATLLPPHHKPLLQSEWVHRYWPYLSFPNVIKKVKNKGFSEVDILYFDTPIQSFWLHHISAKKTVFRVADHHAGFKKATPASLKLEKELLQKVDLVVCTAKSLLSEIKPFAPKAKHLPNGVCLEPFMKETFLPEEYKKIPRPIAIYVGAIEYWFDYDLVNQLADELPHISFVLIGPNKENRFKEKKNIYLLGPKAYRLLPSYLKAADVGMIPFNVRDFASLIHHVNPLKLYEYMASGLPVVSSYWQELATLQSPALLSRSYEEFKTHLLHALKDAKPKQVYQSFAAKHDWSIRAKELLDYL